MNKRRAFLRSVSLLPLALTPTLTERLVQILNGKKLYSRIHDGGSTNPFVLRPGYWVVLDAQAGEFPY